MQVGIFKKNGSAYDPIQTISEGFDPRGLALSADKQELAYCRESLKVYRYNGSQFVLNQTIALEFRCTEVNFMNRLLEVHGMSSEISFYGLNGSGYEPKFAISTNESQIMELSIFDDGKSFTFGGDSESLSTYTWTNASF